MTAAVDTTDLNSFGSDPNAGFEIFGSGEGSYASYSVSELETFCVRAQRNTHYHGINYIHILEPLITIAVLAAGVVSSKFSDSYSFQTILEPQTPTVFSHRYHAHVAVVHVKFCQRRACLHNRHSRSIPNWTVKFIDLQFQTATG